MPRRTAASAWNGALAFCSVFLLLQATSAPVEAGSEPLHLFRGAESFGPFAAALVDVDLRDLPRVPDWKPGDPIRPPRPRYRPRHRAPPPPPLSLPLVTVDPLVELQRRAASVPDRLFGAPVLNFEGQGFTGSFPPDTVGDVGPSHYVQMVNAPGGSRFLVHGKSGGVLAGPIALDTLGSGNCASGGGDPIVIYDHLADRWVLSEFSGGGLLCLYVSQTPDPVSGGWFAYQLDAPSFPDYPKYALWPDAYYISTNEDVPAVYAMDRPRMLAGQPATFQRFAVPRLSTLFDFEALLPADLDGAEPPPPGAPGIFIRQRDDEPHGPNPNDPNQDFLELWAFHVDFKTPGSSWLQELPDVPLGEFSSEICGFTFIGCFPQPSGPKLDPIREVLMFRLVYRNFTDHETLLGNFVVNVDGEPPDPDPGDGDIGGIRWFELRRSGPGGPWSLFQEGTHSPDATNRWMGSIAMDGGGNVALGYNVSSSSVFPGLRYAGRLAGDSAGTLPQGEHSLVDGSSSNSNFRYGDYSALGVDPADDCTFWFTGEHSQGSGWSTRIASFRFDACSPLPTGTPAATVTGTPPTATSTIAQTPVPSSTPTGTPASTRTPSSTPSQNPPPSHSPTVSALPAATSTATATPAPISIEVRFVKDTAPEGVPVEATGSLPPGTFRLCVYPDGKYPLGGGIFDAALSCVDVTSGGGPLPPTVVWPGPVSGEYDLLALRSAMDPVILGGDDLGPAPGLVVQRTVLAHVAPWTLLLGLLLALRLRRRRRR